SGTSGASTVSTGHMEKGAFGTDVCWQIEIGWELVWAPGQAHGPGTSQGFSHKDTYTFTEKQVGCSSVSDLTFTPTTVYTPNTTDKFKIQGYTQPNDSVDWHLYVNHGNGWVGQEDVQHQHLHHWCGYRGVREILPKYWDG